jgi:ATP-binding cassette subfamily F protein uup
MAELELKDATLSFGRGALLDEANLALEAGERVGLLGRNGAGKTTLMRVIVGEQELDEGRVVRRPELTVERLGQSVPTGDVGDVEALLRAHLAKLGLEEWEVELRTTRELERFGLDPRAKFDALSAGMKRRALLARSLAAEPDLLLLDEPTNHLELEAIAQLEEHLQHWRGTLLFVTHDRAFLKAVATRIVDLDRGKLTSYRCDYPTYLERKAADLEAEAKQNAEFDKKLAQEEAWIRQGIKARRTRNMGRVRALKELRNERAQRRDVVGRAKAHVQEADRSGRLVLRATGVDFAWKPDEPIAKGLDLEIQRGDRVGIVGPNGAGKSTLLRLLLGELEPSAGEVRQGTQLEIARFDQLHGTLDERRTVAENVCGDGDTVFIDGQPRNIYSYLSDFLFTPDQARGPITKLSGGERNRLQLAATLAKPCNLLVLDEPTNDLDLETLELLEELLAGFGGTLLLVSHDREFLENVVTSVLARNPRPGGGLSPWTEYLGGYEDWQRVVQREREAAEAQVKAQSKAQSQAKPANKPKAAAPKAAAKPEPKPRKLTFTEKHELERLPDAIDELETRKAALLARMSGADYFKLSPSEQAGDREQLEALDSEILAAMERWEALAALDE